MANNNSSKSNFLSVKQVADYLGVTRQTVTNWIRNGIFKAYRLPTGTLKIRNQEFLKYLQENNLFIDPEFFANDALKVLAVDDDPGVLQFLKDFFARNFPNYDFYTAENGVAGLIKVGEIKPDLLIIDIEMPEMNGMEVCKRILSDPEMEDIKIIIGTGYRDKYIDELEKLNVFAILSKPYTMDVLEETMSALQD
ncbi:MAG: response regulator [Calditrichia bacterium]